MKQINAWAVVVDIVKTYKGVKRNYVLSVHPTRDEARQEKAFQGGKEAGIKIVKLTGDKEVR